MKSVNNGNRTIMESIMVPEIGDALKDWIHVCSNSVLIGGLALSFYVKPRNTQDIDVLFLNENEIPATVAGFKRIRPHAFEHIKTGVEVEVLTSSFINVPQNVVEKVMELATINNGVKIASPSGLIASKIFRLSMQDKADIVSLIKYGNISLSDFNLPQDRLDKYIALISDAENE